MGKGHEQQAHRKNQEKQMTKYMKSHTISLITLKMLKKIRGFSSSNWQRIKSQSLIILIFFRIWGNRHSDKS